MPAIFLSHSSLDKELADELKKQWILETPNIRVFLAPDDIQGGEWRKQVMNELDLAEAMILLITPNSDKSLWVAFEYGYFVSKRGSEAIFPLLHPKSKMRSPLDAIQWELVTDVNKLAKHFGLVCRYLGLEFRSQVDLNAVATKAQNLQVMTAEEREKQRTFRRLLKQANGQIN